MFGMSFELLHAATSYREFLRATDGPGLCMGMSWLWASGAMGGTTKALTPPNVLMGGQVQGEYEAGNQDAIYFFNRKVSELQSKAPGKCLQQRNTEDSKTSVDIVNALADGFSGNAAVIMCWGINKRKSKLDKAFGRYDSAHAMALLKLKHNGKIYLYDPNRGVYEWRQTNGVELKKDIKHFMLSPSRAMVALYSAVMVFTQHDIPLNEHVMG